MMVKNISAATLTFGTTLLPPKKTILLPTGYDFNNPMVKFYMNQKWLKKTDLPVEFNESEDVSDLPVESKIDLLKETPLTPVRQMDRDKIIAELQLMGIEPIAGANLSGIRAQLEKARNVNE